MRISRKRLLFLTLVGLGLVWGLGQGPAAAADKLKVAAVLPGAITDGAFNQGIYEGLMKAKESLPAEIAYSEKVPQSDQVEAMSDYARRGYQLVMGCGGEFTDAAKRVARRFPKVTFAVLNGAPTKDVVTVNFDNFQFGYLLGLGGGRMSKSGIIGTISGQPIKAFHILLEGYKAGLKKAHPEGKVLVAYTNDWVDVAKAKEAALGQHSQGADVIMPYLDKGILGVIKAAQEKSFWVLGMPVDFAPIAPKATAFSLVQSFGDAAVWLIEKSLQGGVEKKDYLIGLDGKTGFVGVFNPKVPPEVKEEILAVQASFQDGTFKK